MQTVDDSTATHGDAYGIVVDSSGIGWTNRGGENTRRDAYLYKDATAFENTALAGGCYRIRYRYRQLR